MSEALRLAKALEYIPDQINREAAAELRRLHTENQYLHDEVIAQACVNGMGSEREARLMALNAELVRALEKIWDEASTKCGYIGMSIADIADAALAKVETSDGS